MIATVPYQDYRVSGISVRCVDCGQDVGLYPARHKCRKSASAPTFWTKIMNIYSHADATAKPRSTIQPQSIPPSSYNFWGRIKTNIFSSNAPPDSDDSDWEEETHVERVLREYYQAKEAQTPDWIANPPPSLPSQTFTSSSYTIVETSKFEEQEAESSVQGELQIDTSRLIYQNRLESSSTRPSPSRMTPTSCSSVDQSKSQINSIASNINSEETMFTRGAANTTKSTNSSERNKYIEGSHRSISKAHTSPPTKTDLPKVTISHIRTTPTKSVKSKQRSIYTQRMDLQTTRNRQQKS